jgi:hypothetical protein
MLEFDGGQKTAITLEQAAKLFALSNLGLMDYLHDLQQFQDRELQSGNDIDVAYSLLLRQIQIEPQTVSSELSHWKSWLDAASPQALAELAQKGFMLQPNSDGTGNTDQRINYFDTDKTLNRGDFESPDFNGTRTHI